MKDIFEYNISQIINFCFIFNFNDRETKATGKLILIAAFLNKI